eukprot:294256-Chlamydomonas_euryale.AAC.1
MGSAATARHIALIAASSPPAKSAVTATDPADVEQTDSSGLPSPTSPASLSKIARMVAHPLAWRAAASEPE